MTGSDGSVQVIVIGAGVAGLAAAHHLHKAGVKVLLLEGRDRIGGRVWTDRTWPDTPLDLGASWIHGVSGNPTAQLASELGVETFITDYDNLALYDWDGRRVTSSEQANLWVWVEELLAAAADLGEMLAYDLSIQEGINRVLAGDSLTAAQQRQLNYALNTLIEHEYANDISQMSLRYWDEDEEFSGDDVLFPGGYDWLVQALAVGLDIRLNQVVSQVIYDQNGVRVMTNSGEFAAAQVIVTLPLGVLQHGDVQFRPPLPQAKQDALQKLCFGVLNKLYLRFPTVFWDKEADLLGYMAANKGEWAEYVNMYRVIGQPILLCFNAGSYGLIVEEMGDEEIVAAAMHSLRTLYGPNIPAPTDWLITRWGADPLARGSYSSHGVGASNRDRDILAEPISGRVFFAGEATIANYSATVHGAYLSGQRAARQLLG